MKRWLIDKYGLSWQISLGMRDDVEQTIVPSLLLVGPQHGRAEEAIHLYTSVFERSSVRDILPLELAASRNLGAGVVLLVYEPATGT